MMKKNLQKKQWAKALLGVAAIIATGIAVSDSAMAAGSTDGTPTQVVNSETDSTTDSTTYTTTGAQSGRALLRIEDMKTLLGMVQDTSALDQSKGLSLNLALSAAETQNLIRQVNRIEKNRLALEAKLDAEMRKQVEALRLKRREIQNSRVTARDDRDQSLSRSLYESILEESNLDARRNETLAQFDDAHVISLEFVELKGNRYVETIHIGVNRIWASMSVARNR